MGKIKRRIEPKAQTQALPGVATSSGDSGHPDDSRAKVRGTYGCGKPLRDSSTAPHPITGARVAAANCIAHERISTDGHVEVGDCVAGEC